MVKARSFLLIPLLLLLVFSAAAEVWICPVCGAENTGRFCDSCGPALRDGLRLPGGAFSVAAAYTWPDGRHAAVLRNTSDTACGFRMQTLFIDASGQLAGVSDAAVDACDPGAEVLVCAACGDPFERVEYQIAPVASSRYDDVRGFVRVTAEKRENGAVLTAVNDGDRAAEALVCRCLFLDAEGRAACAASGEPITLGPGETAALELSAGAPFETVLVYFEGRCRK